ncbi:MAG: type IX secretion system membrane protein PorP/SprF [Bacteroidetes bacterium]|nr:MAG: type IX secretion system membrane protein PorP/SprF [Bacteroidota bacterium]MBL1143595.1 type IX secretion system membrane protein PorP/SprF [Bacteroidota bacterium]MCB0801865.1 type IX secretion system membrane protein PorP/SprF [Flavobacteriales bacterium]NOG56397.1 type IX secretion system membrane protein PorP/SprF [Bacteroidota bacterium]
MKFKKYILIIVLVLPCVLKGQQDPQFNQYFFNPLGINPAYAGSRGMLSAAAVHRTQWVGFEGAPKTQSFAIHAPTRDKKMGFGFQAVKDVIGPKSTVVVSGDYAYSIRIARGRLAFGLRASIYNYQFNWDDIEYKETNGLVNNGTETYMVPSFDYGMYYYDKQNYIGVEFTHLNQGKLGIQSDNVNIESTSRQEAQAIITAGRAFKINRYVVFKPSMLLKTANNKPAFLDLNASVLLNNKLWLGLTYRRGYGGVAIIEYNIDKYLRIGYSYDISLTQLSRENGGSHEIFIGYDFNLFKSRSVSPRYF